MPLSFGLFVLLGEQGKNKDNVPSVADVHKFMIERAKDCPYRQAVLLEIRYGEISKLMRMSAKVGDRGSVDLFLTAVRFAMTLWATTHAVDYVRLGTDILVFMECASPAVKELYARKMFTGLIANGKSEHMDLIMEKSVGHSRQFTGKVNRPGMDKLVESVVEQIPSRSTEEHVRQELRTGKTKSGAKSKTHEMLNDNSPSVVGFDLIHNEIQLWHHELEPIIDETARKEPVRVEPNSFKMPGGESLNSQVPLCYDIGESLKVRYCQKYYEIW